jgi:hypothetical protein
MKRIVVLVSALLWIVGVHAQKTTDKVSVQWGNEFKMSAKMALNKVVSVKDDEITLLIMELGGVFKDPKYHITKIKNDLNYSVVKPIVLQTSGNELSLLEIFELQDEIYLFSLLVDKSKKSKTLYLHTLNRNNLSVSAGTQIRSLNYDNATRRNMGGFEVVLSQDFSKVLVMYYTPYEKGEPEEFGAMVFDNSMELIWENEYELPYADEKFDVNEVFIGNNGQFFLTGTKYNGNKSSYRFRDAKDYSFVLLSSDMNGDELIESDIELKDYYISDMTASMLPNSDIVCAGFTTSRTLSSNINGVFYVLIDKKTREIDIESTKAFEYEFIKEGMSEKQEKKTDKQKAKGKEVSLPSFVFREIILKENGGALVIAEQYWMEVRTYTDAKGNTHTTYHYFYNDIIAVSIDAQGEIEWASKVIKRQHSTNDGGFYSSYVMAVVENKIYFVFNDNIDNLLFPNEKMKNFAPGSSKKSAVTLCELDPLGNVTKEMLFSGPETGVILIPKLSEQISENEIFIYCKRMKKNKFGMLTFK